MRYVYVWKECMDGRPVVFQRVILLSKVVSAMAKACTADIAAGRKEKSSERRVSGGWRLDLLQKNGSI